MSVWRCIQRAKKPPWQPVVDYRSTSTSGDTTFIPKTLRNKSSRDHSDKRSKESANHIYLHLPLLLGDSDKSSYSFPVL